MSDDLILRRQIDMLMKALGGEEGVQKMIYQRVTVAPQVAAAATFAFVHRAETFYRDPNPDDPTPLAFVPARYFTSPGVRYRPPQGQSGLMVEAVVNEGRWIVSCPDLACNAAQVACENDRRFLCHGCMNWKWGGGWHAVQWPVLLECEEIERALLARPDVEQRHWVPGETVAALQAENVRHGLMPRLEE